MAYHINPLTGRPNKCTAMVSCPFGDLDRDHFATKEEARARAESVLSGGYATAPSASKARERVYAEVLATFQACSDSEYGSLEHFFGKELPEANILSTVEQVDYRNEVLFEEKGEKFVAKFYGGDWADFEPLSVDKVDGIVVAQVETKAVEVGELPNAGDELLKKLGQLENTGVFRHFNESTGKESYVFGEKDKVYTRPDGSKLHEFSLVPEGDSSICEPPPGISVPLTMEENGERQNRRQMQNGRVLFDEKTGTGVAFVWQSYSEGAPAYRFKRGKDGKVKASAGQAIYLLVETGETIEAKHWRRA